MGFLTPSYFPYEPNLNASNDILRMAFVSFSPFVYQSRQGDRAVVGGPLRVFVDAIAALAGSRAVAVFSDEIAYGQRLENGSFTGLMGMIQRDEIDVLLGPSLMTDERLELAEPLMEDITSYRLLTWIPSKVVDPFNFISVFTFDVWALILSSLFSLGAIFWLMNRFCTPWSEEPKTTLFDSLWNVFIRLFPQNPTENQEDWYRVCIMTFFLTYSVVLMNFLNSQLISAMTIKDNEDYINTLEDILRFPKVRIYGEADSSLSKIFTSPSNELFRKLKPKLLEVRGVIKHGPPLLEMISEIVSKKRVIVGNPQMCQAVLMSGLKQTGKCPRVQTSSESSGTLQGFLFSSYSLPLATREKIRSATFTIHESSLYQKLIGLTMRTAEKCEAQSRTTAADDIKPLMLQDLQGSFILLAIGIAASLIGILIEMTRDALSRRVATKKNPDST